MGLLRGFLGPWLHDGNILGMALLILALGGPILLLTGSLMFVVHGAQIVPGSATLYAVQNDFWDPLTTMTISAYSWCTYSLGASCPDGSTVNITARRDDFAYNGLQTVPIDRCFADADILNDPGANEEWSSTNCLEASTGHVVCTHPRPVIRAWFKRDECASGDAFSWSLNDPAQSHPRFIAITVAGAVATVLGLGPMCFVWLGNGCDTEGIDYL